MYDEFCNLKVIFGPHEVWIQWETDVLHCALYQSAVTGRSKNKRKGKTHESGGLDMLQPMVNRCNGQWLQSSRVEGHHNNLSKPTSSCMPRTVLLTQSSQAT